MEIRKHYKDTNDEGLASSIKEYVNMKIDLFALKSVEDISIVSSKVILILIYAMLGVVILQLTGFALSYFIGELLNSTALGFLIVGGVFIIAFLTVFLLRKKLFTNSIVKMFINMFFNSNKEENYFKEEQEDNSHGGKKI
jgi:cytochrome c biogenesis protein CcdA